RFTKNGDDADQPLIPALAEALRDYVKGRDPAEPLFPRWGRGAKMLRVDLRAAEIPYETAEGVADLHALRHTFCTDLIEAGVDIKTAHVLMRHKSIEMTMGYAKTDDARKVEAIGRLAERPDWGEALSAVGDGPTCEGQETGNPLERLFGTDNVADLELMGAV